MRPCPLGAVATPAGVERRAGRRAAAAWHVAREGGGLPALGCIAEVLDASALIVSTDRSTPVLWIGLAREAEYRAGGACEEGAMLRQVVELADAAITLGQPMELEGWSRGPDGDARLCRAVLLPVEDPTRGPVVVALLGWLDFAGALAGYMTEASSPSSGRSAGGMGSA